MAGKSKFKADQIELIDVKILKGEISSPFGFDMDLIQGHPVQVSFDAGYNLSDNLVKADLWFTVETESSQEQEEASGHFELSFVFHVGNLKDLVQPLPDSDSLQINPSLGNAIASISYSTSRGILMTRFNGTALSSFILPVINPNDLLK